MLESQLNTIVSDIVAVFTALLQESVVILWNLLISQGFNPGSSYGLILTGSRSFFYVYSGSLGYYLPVSVSLAMILFSLTLILKGPESGGNLSGRLFMPAVSLFLSMSSIFIIRGLLKAETFLYEPVWDSYGGWQFIISTSTGPYSGILSENLVMKIFFIAGYDIPIIAIFLVFAIRSAFLIFAMIILPFVSLLIMIPFTEKFAWSIWKMTIEASVLPLFMLLAVYPMIIIQGNSMIQIGSLFLCAAVPVIFMERGRIFSSLNLSSITGAVGIEALIGTSYGLQENGIPYLVSSGSEMSFSGLPDASHAIFGLEQNPFAIDWNRAYEKSYSERP